MFKEFPLISLHGSHSGEFCAHAKDCTLRDIVEARLAKGFEYFGITEHQPRDNSDWLYPEEVEKGISVTDLFESFSRYMKEARKLQKEFANRAEILVGFETEFLGKDPIGKISEFYREYSPDYIVASVHHVRDISIDVSLDLYRKAVAECGSEARLIDEYFYSVLQLVEELSPEVIGHIDHVFYFGGGQYFPKDLIRDCAVAAVKSSSLVEINTRAFARGRKEPWPMEKTLDILLQEGVGFTLSDDSHGIDDIGIGYDRICELIAYSNIEIKKLRFEGFSNRCIQVL